MNNPELAVTIVLFGAFVAANAVNASAVLIAIFINRRRARESATANLDLIESSQATVPVSVIVATYNEGHSLLEGVRSVLASEFAEFELILVDDGSTDGTVDLLRKEFDLMVHDLYGPRPLGTREVRCTYRSRSHPNLWLVEKENGGKADAINAGVNLARYRYILMTDADCRFHPQALLRTMRVVNFDPARIVGAGGQLRIGNGVIVRDGRLTEALPSKLLVRLQMLEYLTAFLGDRQAWARLNGTPVMSGGYSAWRKDVVLELGGFSTTTTHEDIEFTLRVHEALRRSGTPYEIVTLPDPVVWTDVPDTPRALYLQRKRWQRVTLESTWRYRRMLFNPRYGTVGMLTMPNLLYLECLGPFVELFAYLFVAYLLAVGELDTTLLLAFLVLSFGLTALIRYASLLIDGLYFHSYTARTLLTLAPTALLEPVLFRPITTIARLAAFPEFLAGRTGREAAPAEPRRLPDTTPTQDPHGGTS